MSFYSNEKKRDLKEHKIQPSIQQQTSKFARQNRRNKSLSITRTFHKPFSQDSEKLAEIERKTEAFQIDGCLYRNAHTHTQSHISEP